MNSIYSLLAPFYDAINGSVDYEKWADFYVSEFRRYEKTKTSLVLDLGCGTGSMTLALARRGYDMTGVDNCPEMLDAAQKRSMREGFYGKILYLCQDMTAFELYGTVDAVVCCLDGMNHLTTTSLISTANINSAPCTATAPIFTNAAQPSAHGRMPTAKKAACAIFPSRFLPEKETASTAVPRNGNVKKCTRTQPSAVFCAKADLNFSLWHRI